MSNRNILQALQSAGGAGGAGLDIDEVFSTTLYEGGGSSGKTITTGIDIGNEGGITWVKNRGSSQGHIIIDPQAYPNGNYWIYVNTSGGAQNIGENVFSFHSNGWAVAGSLTNSDNPRYNASSNNYVSWNFRKAPKFFDAITYTGNSTAGRTISHNLGCTVGQVWVKRTNTSNNWICWHRGIANNQYLQLNSTSQAYSDGGIFWNNTTPSSTTVTLGADSGVNASGSTYVMYVFAHNNNDGEFGPDADQDVIKCGSYSGSSSAQEINVGFEPQWLMIKRTDGTSPWRLHDVMRQLNFQDDDAYLSADQSSSESFYNMVSPTPTGFRLDYSAPFYNTSGGSYIYVAIRRGPLVEPESVSKVFAIDNQTSSSAPFLTSNFPVDMVLRKTTSSGSGEVMTRMLQGKSLVANSNGGETTDTVAKFDFNKGCLDNTSADSNRYGYMWRRSPSYFDVVAYIGNGSNRNLNHNLTAVPEMIWFKRTDSAENWIVYHKDAGGTYPSSRTYLMLNSVHGTTAYQPLTSAPTSSVLPLSASSGTNANNGKFICFLFASVSGMLFDSDRGIVSGNDPFFNLEGVSHFTTYDVVDPHSSGFIVNQETFNQNQNNSNYTFYAIAA